MERDHLRPCRELPAGADQLLWTSLVQAFPLSGPVTGPDGVVRLGRPAGPETLFRGDLPLIPAKKLLIPPREELWTLESGRYRPSLPSEAVALVVMAPCDLAALDYLDRVFAEDEAYQGRRRRLVAVGAACSPGPDCFCPPRQEPPSFDLFFAEQRVWSGSRQGEALLRELNDRLPPAVSEPLPACLTQGKGRGFPVITEEFFQASAGASLWRKVGDRCVSCGACSAVCPTCYCYEVVDEALPGGDVTRLREWDNCFFRGHGLVAGGHNFRPSRGERLRFRLEHKLLGFGELRGVPSCVGCGRCKRACPVDIEIAEVVERLLAGEES